QEIFLDHVAAIAEAEHEFSEAPMGIGLHDVPENGAAADLDHRLGAELGLLAQASPQASAQHDDFHRSSCTAIFRFTAFERVAYLVTQAGCGYKPRYPKRKYPMGL